jgi:hypothetical protein
VSIVGTTTIVRASRNRPGDCTLREGDGDVRRGDHQQQRQRGRGANGGAVVPGVSGAKQDEHCRHHRDRGQVDERGSSEDETPDATGEPWTVGDVDFQVEPSPIDEVIADVGGTIG